MSIRQPIPHRVVEKYGVAAALALQTFLICLPGPDCNDALYGEFLNK